MKKTAIHWFCFKKKRLFDKQNTEDIFKLTIIRKKIIFEESWYLFNEGNKFLIFKESSSCEGL